MASHIGLVLEKSDVDMQEFVTKFSNKMPLIAMVTSGYLGYDDFLHTFSSDEVCIRFLTLEALNIFCINHERFNSKSS